MKPAPLCQFCEKANDAVAGRDMDDSTEGVRRPAAVDGGALSAGAAGRAALLGDLCGSSIAAASAFTGTKSCTC